jgi:5'-3' exonuclease
MSKILALIDADGLAYHALRETLEESLTALDEKIQNIFEKTECTHYCMFISKGKYFRHEISKGTYKANRNKYQRQNWVKTLKAVLEDKYGATYMLGVEADDLVNYWYHQDLCIADDGKIEPKDIFESTSDYIKSEGGEEFTFEPLIKIICSADKDILQGIVGKHFDYSYRLEEKGNPDSVIKGSWVETSDEEALLLFWKSMICGDSADNIPGIPGKGIKFVEKLFFNIDDEQSLMNLTLEEYIKEYGTSQGVYEFQKNFRQLYILQTDEDFLREVGQLPELPEIREVIRDSQIENLEINEDF